MLTIIVEGHEHYDESKSEFITTKSAILNLEHSLVSLSKWESIWLKPFISKEQRTVEETLSYIKCMTLNEVDDDVYNRLTNAHIDAIVKYMESPMSATTINNDKQKPSREIITSELIYYWMIALQIPFETQYWHINRLFKLINVTNIKNNPKGNKMSKKEMYSRNTALNAARRKSMNTSG